MRALRVVAVALAVVLLSASGGTANERRPSFGRLALAPRIQPTQSALADLNHDGRLDVVTAVGRPGDRYAFTQGVSVMLGTDEGMAPSQLYNVPGLVTELQLVDADGDGAVDVFTNSGTADEPGPVHLLPGAPDGSVFDVIGLDEGVRSMAVGRFRSARPDLVLLTDEGVVGRRNLGGYAFDVPEPLPIDDPERFVVADFEGDSQDELVTVSADTMTVWRSFLPAATASIPSGAESVEVVDATGDGLPELLVVTGGELRVYDAALTVLEKVAGAAGTATAGDLDADGRPELVVAGPARIAEVHDGATRRRFVVPLASAASDVLVGDIDGDGRGELLAVETDASIIEVVDDYRTAPTPPRLVSTWRGGWQTVFTDLNGDGKTDMLAANCWTYLGDGVEFQVRSYLGDGQGGMTYRATVTAHGSLCTIDAGDVNGDGKADLVMSDYYPGGLRQWLGNGDGTFAAVGAPVGGCNFAADATALGDFNDDGYADAAIMCRGVGYPAVVAIAAGSPVGLVRTPIVLPYQFSTTSYVLRMGDLNGDGNLDIVVGSFSDPCLPAYCFQEEPGTGRPVTYFLGNGDLTFAGAKSYRPGEVFFDIAVADTNGDGRDDIITPQVFVDEVRVRRGNADGTLQPIEAFPTQEYPTYVAAGDVDGDRRSDLMFSHGPNMISVMLSTAEGGFTNGVGYAAQNPLGAVYLAHLDGDGKLDAAAVQAGRMELFLQR